MIKKILRYITLKKVEILVYRSADLPLDEVSFQPYEVLKKQTNYRETEYKVLDHKKLVHTSTVFSFSPTLQHLKCKGLLIGNCYTSPDYRGQSVYSKMLQYILLKSKVPREKYFVFVHPENKASIAGIEKAGFKKILLFKANKRMHFFYNEEITRFRSETDATNLHV